MKLTVEIPDDVFEDAVKKLITISGDPEAVCRQTLETLCETIMVSGMVEYLRSLDEWLILFKMNPQQALYAMLEKCRQIVEASDDRGIS